MSGKGINSTDHKTRGKMSLVTCSWAPFRAFFFSIQIDFTNRKLTLKKIYMTGPTVVMIEMSMALSSLIGMVMKETQCSYHQLQGVLEWGGGQGG